MSLTASQLSLARQYIADKGTSAVQSILIQNANGGTFTISYSGQTTSALAYNAGANDVQNALAALSNIGVGNINVVQTPQNTALNVAPYMVYFAGTLANVAQAMFTVNTASLDSSSPLTPSATVAQVASGGLTVFSDDELNALYTNAISNFFLMIAYVFRVLLTNAAKFDDYVAGQTQEKKSQIFAQLKELAGLYQQWANAAKQFQFASMVPEPPRARAVPWTVGSPATSLQYGIPPRYNRWYRGGW